MTINAQYLQWPTGLNYKAQTSINVPTGRNELTNYIASYRSVVPGSPTLREVESIAMAPQVDTFVLQKLIDEQIQKLPIDYDQM